MKRAAEKLKSSRGASLMMALLLFLTCAVVGSAVLTAGTAASGRMSKIAESDQRYYSVNSAANLLIDLFKDETVTIRKVVDSTSSTPEVYVKSKNYPTFTPYSYDESKNTLPLEMAYLHSAADGSFPVPVSLTLSSDKISSFPDVSGKIFSDGKLEFAIVSKGTEKYTLTVTFAADKRETKNVELKDEKTITTTETSYTWKLSDVK